MGEWVLEAAGQSSGVMLFLAGVAFIAGLSRGFSGFGAALIFIPLASMAVGPRMAAPILLMIDAVGALPMLPWAWRHAERKPAFTMSLGAGLGIPIGVTVLAGVEPLTLRWGISVTILLLVVLLASGWRYYGRPHWGVTMAVGGVSGLLSGAAQIGGPPAVAFWLGRAAASAQDLRANIVLYFACNSVWSVIAFTVAGLFSKQAAMLALTTAPGYLAGTMLGMRMFGLASPQTFRRICYALITAAAIIGLPVFR